jgi:hypothetical protein
VQNPPAGTTSTSKYILTGVRATPRPGAARGASDPETTGGAASESSAAATGTDAAAATGAAAAGGTGGGAAAGRGRGAAGGPAPQIRYQLDGDEKVITPHLNHVVEIVGVLSGEPPPAPARGAAPGGAPAPITQTLKIESLKMVAALCQ